MKPSERPGAGPVEVVRARRFELVDADGAVRAVLGDLGAGRGEVFGLALLGAQGWARVRIELGPLGPTVALDQDGNDVIALGVHDAVADALRPGAHLQLSDRHGRPVLGWQVEADGSMTVRTGPRGP